MLLIREMLSKIEEEHQSKLQQLDSIKVQHDNFFQNNTDKTGNFDPFNFNTSVPDSLQKNSTINNSNSLSLDDKERIASQKEQLRRLNNEQPLVPQAPKSFSQSNHKAKDLTSTLINANLNMLPSNSGNSLSNLSSNMDTTRTVQYSSNLLFNDPPNAQFAPSRKPNLSAFDSLIISDLSQKPTGQSLNALKSSVGISATGPMATNFNAFNQSSISQTKSAKQLSKSELDEFLN